MKVCFGIVCIGQQYYERFERLFKPSISGYCFKHGYDLKIFTDFLDRNRNHPDIISFQKCLVPSFLMDYDMVIILDADIYIEPYIPPIHKLNLYSKIGIVNEFSQSTAEQYKYLNEIKITDYPTEYYKKSGFILDTDKILNTGLIICNPKIHATYLKSVYEKYVDNGIGHPRKFHYEQSCIGYELQKDNEYVLISNAWNFLYPHAVLTNQYPRCYFLHFAGTAFSIAEKFLAAHTTKRIIGWRIKQ